MPGGLHPHAHVDSSLLQIPIKSLCFTIAVVQFLFTILTSLFHQKCNRLKARVIIYAYSDHAWLLSPEPLVVKQLKFTRVEGASIVMKSFSWVVWVPSVLRKFQRSDVSACRRFDGQTTSRSIPFLFTKLSFQHSRTYLHVPALRRPGGIQSCPTVTGVSSPRPLSLPLPPFSFRRWAPWRN